MYGFFKRRGDETTEQGDRRRTEMSKSLDKNTSVMKSYFRDDNDFVTREFEIPASGGIRAAAFYIDGLVSVDMINSAILRPLMLESRKMINPGEARFKSIEDIRSSFLLTGEIKTESNIDDAPAMCLCGDTVLMLDGFAEYICINTKSYEKRAVSEPQTETVVRGSREGFTEVLRVNTSLIRRRLQTPDLRLEMMKIGKRTNTSVCLAYIDGIINPEIVDEVRRRLRNIDTDAILNSGYIEEFIEDSPKSVFQTIYYSEKPDIVVAKLLEGRCALIIDGTPFVLTVPMLFVEGFQSPEDYAMRPLIATFLRFIRTLAFFLSLGTPAVYVALTQFHKELIPTPLLFTIANSSENIPFNTTVETALMLITFEILKEAGIRLPKPIGQAVSIVGALVMGQAAIQAGLVGSMVVIVIAMTAVASFLIPILSDSVTLLRWYLLLLAGVMGGFGIALGIMTILLHMGSLKSFGASYLYPIAPFEKADMKDVLLRAPMWRMNTRPKGLRPQDIRRQKYKKNNFDGAEK